MTYYILQQELRDPGIAVVGQVPEEIDPYDWMYGKLMPAPAPDLRLPLARTSGEYRGDIMSGLVTLFSDDLKDLVTEFGADNVQYFPVELEDLNSGEIEFGYWLTNVVGRLQCVDVSRSVIEPVPSGGKGELKSFVIDPSAARDFAIFRLAEDPTLIIINEALKQRIDSAEMVGLRLRATEDYDGW